MKLRNKKTGEIPEKIETIAYIQWSKKIMMIYINSDGERIMKQYDSLETFNEEWEDYEESKESKKYWFINSGGETVSYYEDEEEPEDTNACKEIGNYFNTREEAEKAREKLKAFKRLRDKGFRFTRWTIDDGLRISICSNIDEEDIYDEDKRKMKPDLELLFGGEE